MLYGFISYYYDANGTLYQAVLSLTTLPDGLIVSGSSDRSIRLWNIYQHTAYTTTSNTNSTYSTNDYAIKDNINFTNACVMVLEGQKVGGCLIV